MKLLSCEMGQPIPHKMAELVKAIKECFHAWEYGYYYPQQLGLGRKAGEELVQRQLDRLIRFGALVARRNGCEIAFWREMEMRNV